MRLNNPFYHAKILRSISYRAVLVTAALLFNVYSLSVQAVPQQAREAINGNWSEWVVDACMSGGGGATEATGASGPGSIFVIGDSIGNGLTNYGKDPMPLGKELGSDWSISGDSKDGRPLSQGIEVAKSAPQGLQDADYVLVVQGSNADSAKGNPEGITEMVAKINEATKKDAPIFWLNTNLVKRGIIDQNEVNTAKTFNEALSKASGITVINNTVQPGNDGVHPNYGQLAPVVASAFKGGSTASQSASTSTPAAEESGARDTKTPEDLRSKLASLIFVRANTVDQIKSAAAAKVGGIFVRPSSSGDSATYEGIKSALASFNTLVGVDLEGGRVHAPGKDIVGAVPSAQEMGKMSEDEIKKLAKGVGDKLVELGINIDFAPTVDIGGTNNAVIGDRAFANNPEEIIKKAGAFAAGLSEAGVGSTLKHFPGHGSREGDSHSGPVATAPLSDLEARDLKPYLTLGKNAKTAIMMGHLKVPEWGAQATSLNPKAYQYLRNVTGFKGLVVTDALDMQGVGSPVDQPSRSLLAITSGADMALIASVDQIKPTLDKLEAAAKSGSLTEARINEAAGRVTDMRNGVTATDQSATVAGCQCTASGTGTVPVDGENPKRVFQYFLSLKYSPEQAAAVVANIMHESGVQPQRLQGTASGAITPASKANGSSLGWGLVQWTPAGKFINAVGVDKADDIAVQLEFLAKQLDGEPPLAEKAAGDKLKAATTIEDATLAFISFERFKNWNNAAGEPERQERIAAAKGVFDQYSNLSGLAASSGGGCGGGSGIAGVDCPANIEEHPTQKGYFKMPAAENGEYVFYGSEGRKYGSKQLICVLYTVGLAYDKEMGGKSKLTIGDLNAAGHKSHTRGIAVDLSGQGEIVAADNVNSPSKYDTGATITLGKMFVDTGQLRNIWWCEPGGTPKPRGVAVDEKYYSGNDGSTKAIRDYAKGKNALEGDMYCISGHFNHFHVDIKEEYALPGSFTP